MVKLEDAIVARYEAKGHKLEILVDPKVIDMVKGGKDVNIVDYMVIDEVFKDARKGDKVGEEVLKEVLVQRTLMKLQRQSYRRVRFS